MSIVTVLGDLAVKVGVIRQDTQAMVITGLSAEPAAAGIYTDLRGKGVILRVVSNFGLVPRRLPHKGS